MSIDIDHVGLSVGDLDAVAAWYSTVFDLATAFPFELDAIGLRGMFLIDGRGGAIELLQRRGSQRSPTPADPNEALLRRGYGHVCLRVDDVDEVHARALAAGGTEKMAPQPSPEPGVRMSFVADLEGNLVELLDRAHPVGRPDMSPDDPVSR
ncbi:VOC family protein [Nocardioides sp. NPDC101246]|uniref:VOC family protein n=1 Tax=Nocardioides sp. NPDC101246 TaxID=3364336 RepID=UPI0037F1094C